MLIDLDAAHLDIVRRLSERIAAARGVDLCFTTTTDQRAGLTDVDAVLSSYRPGGFEARRLDERIPLAHGLIGQETQGPGGFFMALRSIHVLQGVISDLEQVAPSAASPFNYTNPVNIVAQAAPGRGHPLHLVLRGHIRLPTGARCCGRLDPARVQLAREDRSLNHTTTWLVTSDYDGADAMPAIEGGLGADAGNGGRHSGRPAFGGAGRDDGRHPSPVPVLLLLPRGGPRGARVQAYDPLPRTS